MKIPLYYFKDFKKEANSKYENTIQKFLGIKPKPMNENVIMTFSQFVNERENVNLFSVCFVSKKRGIQNFETEELALKFAKELLKNDIKLRSIIIYPKNTNINILKYSDLIAWWTADGKYHLSENPNSDPKRIYE